VKEPLTKERRKGRKKGIRADLENKQRNCGLRLQKKKRSQSQDKGWNKGMNAPMGGTNFKLKREKAKPNNKGGTQYYHLSV